MSIATLARFVLALLPYYLVQPQPRSGQKQHLTDASWHSVWAVLAAPIDSKSCVPGLFSQFALKTELGRSWQGRRPRASEFSLEQTTGSAGGFGDRRVAAVGACYLSRLRLR